jgi:hypothetical protein
VFTPLTGWHCKFRPNPAGKEQADVTGMIKGSPGGTCTLELQSGGGGTLLGF